MANPVRYQAYNKQRDSAVLWYIPFGKFYHESPAALHKGNKPEHHLPGYTYRNGNRHFTPQNSVNRTIGLIFSLSGAK